MPLQREFRHLGALLGLYSAGNVPAEYSGTVGLTVDALPFLSEPQTAQVHGVVAAVGQGGQIIVPANEIWLITDASLYTKAVLNNTLAANIYIDWVGKGNAFNFLLDQIAFNAAAGTYFGRSAHFSTPVWCPNNGYIKSRVSAIGGAAGEDLYMSIQYMKIVGGSQI